MTDREFKLCQLAAAQDSLRDARDAVEKYRVWAAKTTSPTTIKRHQKAVAKHTRIIERLSRQILKLQKELEK